MFSKVTKFAVRIIQKPSFLKTVRQCHGVFGINDLIQHEKPQQFSISPVVEEDHDIAMNIIKQHFLSEHVLVQSRNMDLNNDRALDEYLLNLLRQGNSFYAKTEDDSIAGLCVSFAGSPVDPKKLMKYAFYRQDVNTKDFLHFTAKLQETPNLWDIYKQPKVFEIKMITVIPEYRRQGIATLLVEKSKEHAYIQGHKIVRMDCINPFDYTWCRIYNPHLLTGYQVSDSPVQNVVFKELCYGRLWSYKIAERCMLQCIVKFPLHKVRGGKVPFITQTSEHNRCVRVYVQLQSYGGERDKETMRQRQSELENMIE